MKLKNNTVPKSKVAKRGKASKNGQTEIFKSSVPEHSDVDTLKGWKIKKLGTLCDIQLGKTPYRKEKSFWDTEKQTKNVWLSIADLLNTNSSVVTDSKEYISNKAANISKVVKKGTLLVSFKLTLGRLAFAGRDLFTNEAIAALTIKNEREIDKFFLYKYLSFFDWHKAAEGDIKLKGKTLNKAKLKNIDILFPKSLPEQKRIVSILDQAFAAIDQAKANAEKNLNNARALFESYLQGVFEKKGDNWETKKLGDLSRKIMTGPFGSMLHKSDYVEDGIPVVNPQNLVGGKIISLSKTMISRDTFERLRKFALKAGDIVIARRGEMGRCGIVREENVNWLCGTGSFVIRTNTNKVYSEFLNILLSSNIVKKKLEKVSIGATMSNLNQTILSGLSISIPDLDQQKAIVSQLDGLRAETQKLETFYQTKINNLEELKKSILQKAFKGELTQAKHYDLQEDSFSLVAEPEHGEIPKG